jgi:autotransporter-associated beta strand protein
MNGAGGFNTAGSFGTIILTRSNSYSGATTVNGGTLLINGTNGTSPITIANGSTLGGKGIIKGAVTNQSGGVLQPGLGGTDISTLTISNNLVLAGTTVMVLNRTNAQTSSRIVGIATLTQGGTLLITNIGPALQANDTFVLFNASAYNSSFSTITLPALDPTLAWSNSIPQNGTLTVFAQPPSVPTVTNLPASQIQATAATLNGQVLLTGGQVPNVTIYYGPVNGGTTPSAWSNSVSVGAQSSAFGATVSGLRTNTTYYFTASASNSTGIGWAVPSQSFTTLASNIGATRIQVLTCHYTAGSEPERNTAHARQREHQHIRKTLYLQCRWLRLCRAADHDQRHGSRPGRA